MTLPDRTPLGADDMAKLHPSTWEAEAKALWIAASNALHKLEQSRFSNSEHEQAKAYLRAALQQEGGE